MGTIGGSKNCRDGLRWVFVIYAILVNISWNGCEKRLGLDYGNGFFYSGGLEKKQEVMADTKWVSKLYEARYYSWLNDEMRTT